jgi:hypothetical protein
MWAKVKPRFCGFCVVQGSVLILAYANDIDSTGRKQGTVKEAFISLEKADKKVHLQINQEKTKYMPIRVTKKGCAGGLFLIEIDAYKFEAVHN